MNNYWLLLNPLRDKEPPYQEADRKRKRSGWWCLAAGLTVFGVWFGWMSYTTHLKAIITREVSADVHQALPYALDAVKPSSYLAVSSAQRTRWVAQFGFFNRQGTENAFHLESAFTQAWSTDTALPLSQISTFLVNQEYRTLWVTVGVRYAEVLGLSGHTLVTVKLTIPAKSSR